ncbi:hypothetical protein RhiirA4_475437 [Rhizophagus irregularis]|uniref:Uncharacterized protein n=1 Tax=Rhizophagus irregularis TaxID=588596 RepID=A0A2I1HA52_9GLOM|nr:hypothetical protein RhiirA4_475437 [Rhizophagus irregularis]
MEVASEISFVTADEIIEKLKRNPYHYNHQKVSSGVLLAPVSSFWLQLLMSYPYLMINTPDLMKKTFFSPTFPDSMTREIYSKSDENCTYGVGYDMIEVQVMKLCWLDLKLGRCFIFSRI